MALEPLLHSLHLLMTEVLGVFHSGGDAVLEGGQVTVLEVQLGHCLIRELGNEHFLEGQTGQWCMANVSLCRCVTICNDREDASLGIHPMHTQHAETSFVCTHTVYL